MTTSYIYVRVPGTRIPVGCIAYRTSRKEDKEIATFAYSTCHIDDLHKFSKTVAKNTAAKRLESDEKLHEVEIPQNSNRHVVVRKILSEISKSGVKKVFNVNEETSVKLVPEFPGAMRKFSKKWLRDHPVDQDKDKNKNKKKKKNNQ